MYLTTYMSTNVEDLLLIVTSRLLCKSNPVTFFVWSDSKKTKTVWLYFIKKIFHFRWHSKRTMELVTLYTGEKYFSFFSIRIKELGTSPLFPKNFMFAWNVNVDYGSQSPKRIASINTVKAAHRSCLVPLISL